MKKLFATSLVVLSLIGSISMPAFAASSDTKGTGIAGTSSSVSEGYHRRQKPELTAEQKAEHLAKIQDSQKKWSALTDAQKNEIYALYDKQIDLKSQTIDQYLQYGIIDKDTADKMKSKLAERKEQIRKSGKMPMIAWGK